MARTPSRPRPLAVEPELARTAFESITAQIAAITLPEGSPPGDLKAIANAALELSALAEDPTLRPRFEKLPEDEFDALLVDQLTAYARALQHCLVEQEAAAEARGEVVLPEALITHAVDLRARMLKVVIHYFEDDQELAPEVKALGRKKGYAATVSDLQKLAGIYEARKTVVERDPKYWRAGDAQEAREAASEIEKALAAARGEAEQRFSEASQKLGHALGPVFEEVRSTALWLLRKVGGAEKVPALPVTRVRKPKAEKTETEPSPEAPPASPAAHESPAEAAAPASAS
ncbi:MAG: hypothetical protein JNK72_25190 [Myxococcales bacterium]|nr:hypothetical protein [Myxococcales bacterium]